MERGWGQGGKNPLQTPCLVLPVSAGAPGGCGSRAELRWALGHSANAWLHHPPTTTCPPPGLTLCQGGLSPFILLLLLETQILVATPRRCSRQRTAARPGRRRCFGAITQGLNSMFSSLASSSTIRSQGPSALTCFLPGACPGSGLKLLPSIWAWFLILEFLGGGFCKHLHDPWLL